MAKRYRITWEVNSTSAESAARRVAAGFERAEKAAEKAAAAMSKALGAGAGSGGGGGSAGGGGSGGGGGSNGPAAQARAQAKAAREAAAAQAKAAREAAKAQAQAAREAAREQARLAREAAAQARAAQKAAAAQARAAHTAARQEARANGAVLLSDKQKHIDQQSALEDRWFLKEYSGRAAHQARVQRNEERSAAQLDAIQDRMLKKDYDRRVRHEQKKIKEAERARKREADLIRRADEDEKNAFKRAAASAAGFAGAVTGAGVALAGLEVGKRLVSELVGAFNQAKDSAMEMADKTLATLATLREIASIKGKGGPDRADLEHHLQMREKSGLTAPEAESYENELLNALGTVSKERLSDKERENLGLEGAKVAGRRGGGAAAVKARATIHGLLPNYMPKGSTAKDVVAKAEQIDDILGLGAAKQEVSVHQYQQLMTSLTSEKLEGFLHNPAQAAGLNALASSFAPTDSATATLEAVRGVSSLTKEAKAKGAKSTQAQTLRDAGITEHMDPEERLRKLFQYADKNFKGEAFDVAMARRGFRNTTDNRRLAQFYETYQKGDFDRIMGLTHAKVDESLPEARQKEFAASETGQKLMARQAKEVAVERKGLEHTTLNIARDNAEAKLIDEGLDDTTAGAVRQRAASLASGGREGRAVLAEDRALQELREQAGQRRKGLVRQYAVEHAPSAFANAFIPGLGAIPGLQHIGEGLGAAYDAFTGGGSGEAKKLRESIDKNTAAQQARGGVPGAPAPIGPKPPAGVHP